MWYNVSPTVVPISYGRLKSPVLLSRPHKDLETKAKTLTAWSRDKHQGLPVNILRTRTRPRQSTILNSSALETQNLGLEIRSLIMGRYRYGYDVSTILPQITDINTDMLVS